MPPVASGNTFPRPMNSAILSLKTKATESVLGLLSHDHIPVHLRSNCTNRLHMLGVLNTSHLSNVIADIQKLSEYQQRYHSNKQPHLASDVVEQGLTVEASQFREAIEANILQNARGYTEQSVRSWVGHIMRYANELNETMTLPYWQGLVAPARAPLAIGYAVDSMAGSESETQQVESNSNEGVPNDRKCAIQQSASQLLIKLLRTLREITTGHTNLASIPVQEQPGALLRNLVMRLHLIAISERSQSRNSGLPIQDRASNFRLLLEEQAETALGYTRESVSSFIDTVITHARDVQAQNRQAFWSGLTQQEVNPAPEPVLDHASAPMRVQRTSPIGSEGIRPSC